MTKELVLSLESFSREIDCRRPALCLDAAAEIERLERVVADLHHDIASHDCPRLPDEPAGSLSDNVDELDPPKEAPHWARDPFNEGATGGQCPTCGEWFEVVRPGKWQPHCDCATVKSSGGQSNMKPHEHKRSRTCCCYIQGLEPNEDCPLHGGGEWPPRCETCGQLMSWPKDTTVQPSEQR